MTSLFKSIDYGSGSVSYLEEGISYDKSIEDQLDYLREDLLQVEYYGGRLVLDVGWYPSFRHNGQFKITVVEQYDWQNPIYKVTVNNIELLVASIKVAIALVEVSS